MERFWIGRYPVTNAQYRVFLESGDYDRRELWTDAGREWREGAEVDVSPYPEDLREGAKKWLAGRPKEKRREPFFWDDPRLASPSRPVVGITWFEALAFTRWLAAHLGEADAELIHRLGLERLAMAVYGIKDIRQLYLSDARWLEETPLCL